MPRSFANGIELYYETHGRGEPVLFIHGLGSSTRDWELQVPAFKDQFKVYLIDLRGHGRSDKPAGPYSISLFVEDLRAFLESQNLTSVHLIGLSLGGCIALQFALDYPQQTRSLVPVNSFVELPNKTFQEKYEFLKRTLIIRLLGMRKIGEVLAGRVFPEPHQVEIRSTFIERWAENDKQAYLHSMKSMAGWSVKDRLSELKASTLVVSGDKDYTPVDVKKDYVTNMPNAGLTVIKNSHHGTPVDQPDEFNRVVLEFLSKQLQ